MMMCGPILKRFIFAALVVMTLAGCALAPTKMFQQNQLQPKEDLATQPQSQNLVVIDARPAFKFSLGSVPGAINLDWQSFSQRESKNQGYLDQDLFFISRRLASYGIGLNSEVLVLGEGLQGQGEEGRLAWMLKYLGVRNVKWTHIDLYRRDSLGLEAPPHQSVPVWKPELDESLAVDKAEFLQMAAVTTGAPLVIDVRSSKEYLKKSHPNIHAINIPWSEMIDKKGEIKKDLKNKMLSIGLKEDQKYYLVSERGVRSAYALLILRKIGFKNTTHFAGGYQALP